MAAGAKYTVVIPTRNRQTYCAEAALTVLLAQRDDVQLIVLDNSDDAAALPALFEQLGIRELVQIVPSADRPLRMDENWERGVPLIEGEWVSYIGDDDGFKIDAFDQLDFLTKNFGSDAFVWLAPHYKWPCFPGVEGGLLTMKYEPFGLAKVDAALTRDQQRDWVPTSRWPSAGPTVYHSLIRKRVIDDVVRDHGRYFLNYTVDYSSGIANLHYLEDYMVYRGFVSIQGGCGGSNTAVVAEEKRSRTVRDYFDELGGGKVTYDEFLDARLHTPIVESSFRNAIETLGGEFRITPETFVRSCALELRTVRDEQSFYEERDRVRAFAAAHGVQDGELESMTYARIERTTGILTQDGVVNLDTLVFGWNGIVDVATKLHAVSTAFAVDQQRHLKHLALYAAKFDDARALLSARKLGLIS